MNVRILRSDFERLHAHLFQNGIEQHAFMLAEHVGGRLLVRDLLLADPARDVVQQSPVYVSLHPHYVINALESALQRGLHVIDVHSHPFCETGVAFSGTDFRSAATRFEWHRERAPEMISTGVVFGRRSVDGRVMLPGARAPQVMGGIEVAGKRHEVWRTTSSLDESVHASEQFDRQVRAFGEDGQRRIESVHVGVVGLGGTGSALVIQLAHLGVRRWTLVDGDCVEATNLNRLIGATIQDIGRPKVAVAARVIRGLVPDAEITSVTQHVPDEDALTALVPCDLLFGCGDNAGVRVVLTRLATQHLLPYIDLGTAVTADRSCIERAGGQVFSSWPGQPCLSCYRRFDGVAAAAALRSKSEQASHAEIYGTESPQPSVVTLNSTIASIASGEFLKFATGWAEPATLTLFDGGTNRTETIRVQRDPKCPMCSMPAQFEASDLTRGIPVGR